MKKKILLKLLVETAAVLSVLALGSTATAGIYTDDFSRYLVSKSSEADKTALVQWIFAAASKNPALASMVSLTAAQSEVYNRKGAELLQRLVTQDCRAQAIEALKNEGSGVIETGFPVLGEIAGRGLMIEPHVGMEMQKLSAYLDEARWSDLMKAAGHTAQTQGATRR